MSEVSLKPCPLCGCTGTRIHIDRFAPSYIECETCPMRVQFYESGCNDTPTSSILFTLIASWNRRVEE